MRMSRLVPLVAILVAAPAIAADRYVRTDGNDTRCTGAVNAADTGSGTSQPCAWKTVGKCAGSTGIVAGDRCLIQPGTYDEASITQAPAGVLDGQNILFNCTCTKGATSITCGSAIPATVAPGKFVQCDDGNGFSWSVVSAVSGSTITLGEPYRGATSDFAASSTLDVARFVQFLGQGTKPEDVLISNWQAEPGAVSWTLETDLNGDGTADPGSCVYSYPRASVPSSTKGWGGTSGGSTTPFGYRDTVSLWDLSRLPHNGEDPYLYVEGSVTGDTNASGSVQNCPCGESQTLAQAVNNLPGSWGFDANKVFVHPRHRCAGGVAAGYNCFDDTDCVGGTCGACEDPDTLGMQGASSSGLASYALTSQQPFTIWERVKLAPSGRVGENNGGKLGPAKNLIAGALLGASNSRYSELTVAAGVVRFGPAGGSTDVLFDRLRALDGNLCGLAESPGYSGLAWVANEWRGNWGNAFSCDAGSGVTLDNPIVLDRAFIHRNFNDYIGNIDGGTTCNGNGVEYDCAAKKFVGEQKYRGNHCVYQDGDRVGTMQNWKVTNSVIELCTDGMSFFCDDGETGIVVNNNTFGTTERAHRLKLRFGGDVGTGCPGFARNNLLVESDALEAKPLLRGSTVAAANRDSDYNLVLNYREDGCAGCSTPTSPTFWGVLGSSGASESLATVITNYARETHSIAVCASDCAGASPGTYFNGGGQPRLADVTVDDGTPTNYTPLAGFWGINTGDNASCPPVDFYGNPRSDGQCDIGAIEYQGAPANTVPNVTGVTGTVQNGQTITIAGSGFGTKTTPAPVVFDDATGTDIRVKWSGAWPSVGVAGTDCASTVGGDPQYNTTYKDVSFRSVGAPHPFATRMIAGAHGQAINFCAGNDVLVWKNFLSVTFPWDVYLSWWERGDASWVPNPGNDGNLKTIDWSGASNATGNPEPYKTDSTTGEGRHWYESFLVKNPIAPTPGQCPSSGSPYGINDNATGASRTIETVGCNSPQVSAGCSTPTDCTACNGAVVDNPFCTWSHYEIDFRASNQSGGGIFRRWKNGTLVYEYLGRTDNFQGPLNRSLALGGFARDSSATNWRYFVDPYLDAGPNGQGVARVMICDGSTWAARGYCEPQLPSAWSSTSITAQVRQAAFPGGSTRYLYVVEPDRDVNPSGFAVTFSTPPPQSGGAPSQIQGGKPTLAGGTVK